MIKSKIVFFCMLLFVGCYNNNSVKLRIKDSVFNKPADSLGTTKAVDTFQKMDFSCSLDSIKKLSNCEKINYITGNTFSSKCFESLVNYMAELTKTKHHGSYGFAGFYYTSASLYQLDLKNWRKKLKCFDNKSKPAEK